MRTSSIEIAYQRRWLVLSVLCLSILLVVVSNMALNVALPTLGYHLHASGPALAWIVDVYVLCFAGLLLPGGAIGDRFGRKGTLQCGLAIFALAAGLGAFSVTVWQLILARAVMGIGAALVMPGTLSILASVFPPPERPRAIAVWASVAGASVAVSITWSGLMLEHFWWGSIFLGMAAVAVLALVAGDRVLPTSRDPGEARLDPLGALLSVIGVSGLLFGFIQAPDDGWTSPIVLVAFAVGLTALVVFWRHERRVARPMFDVGLFRQRHFALGSLAIAAAYFALFGMYFVFTQYFQLVRGYSPLEAGLYALPAGLAQLAVAQLAAPLVARCGIRRVLVGGLLASAAGLLVLATSAVQSSPWGFEAGLGLLGAGIGLTMPPATGAIMSSLPPHKAGVGSAVNDLDRELGGAFGIGVLGSLTLFYYQSHLDVGRSAHQGLAQILTVSGGPDSAIGLAARTAYSSGLDLAMIVGAVLVLTAAMTVYLALPSGPRRVPADRSQPSRVVSDPPQCEANEHGLHTAGSQRPVSVPTVPGHDELWSGDLGGRQSRDHGSGP